MTRRAKLPPYLHGAAFHVRDRSFHLATAGRLRASDLQRPFTGVRTLGLDLTKLIDRCRAYEPLLRRDEAFSPVTAALLYGLPLPKELSTPSAVSKRQGDVSSPQALESPAENETHERGRATVAAESARGVVAESSSTTAGRTTNTATSAPSLEVTAPPGVARARTKGVRGHVASAAPSLDVQHGLPVIASPFVWCQLASRLSFADVVAVGDAIVTGPRKGSRRAPGLATVAELEAAARTWGRRRGAATLARALPCVRVGAESRPETHLRLLLVDAGLPEPVLNDPTNLSDGSVLHPDLKYPQWRIVLEYQGDRHRRDRRRWQEDVRRKRAFESAGWRVVEVTSDDLYVDSTGLLARIAQLIDTR